MTHRTSESRKPVLLQFCSQCSRKSFLESCCEDEQCPRFGILNDTVLTTLTQPSSSCVVPRNQLLCETTVVTNITTMVLMNHQSSRHYHDERSWSVVLFRFTESTGWEKEVGGDKDGIATMVSPRKDRYELLAKQSIKICSWSRLPDLVWLGSSPCSHRHTPSW